MRQGVANLSILTLGTGDLQPLIGRRAAFARRLDCNLHGSIVAHTCATGSTRTAGTGGLGRSRLDGGVGAFSTTQWRRRRRSGPATWVVVIRNGQATTTAQRRQFVRGQRSVVDAHPIGAMQLMQGQFHIARIGAAIGQYHQAFRVHVEPSNGFQVLKRRVVYFAHARLLHALQETGTIVFGIDFGHQFTHHQLVHKPHSHRRL
jgi:hypothetical protein